MSPDPAPGAPAQKMSFMQFCEVTREFIRSERTIPSLRPGEVLVRVRCCTICGSDLHTFCGRRSAPEHCVMGHEIIGEIVDWSRDTIPTDFHGNPLTKGQRVTWAMAVGCGSCFYCKNKLGQKCESLFKYGHEAGTTGPPTGGLSEYCVLVSGTPIFPIPDALSDEAACPANCATATASAALRLISETHRIQEATVIVVGAGMLGLTAAAQLKHAGARNVVVVDTNTRRLELAHQFGATHSVNASDRESQREILESLTSGRGADIAVDFAGVTPAVETCLLSVRTGGCVLLAGSVFPTDDISLSPEKIVRQLLTIRGLHNYLPSDLESALKFLEETQDIFPFSRLVEASFPLKNTSRAFAYAASEQPLRVSVTSRTLSRDAHLNTHDG